MTIFTKKYFVQKRQSVAQQFGMKAHIGFDADSGLVHNVAATKANAQDIKQPFRVIKCQFGNRKVRYRGLAKNNNELLLIFALSNLWMVPQTNFEWAAATGAPGSMG